MKLKRLFSALALSFLALLTPLTPVSAAGDVQDFTFSDFTADYYLEKTSDGGSVLHVKETLVAEFPYTDQNHGITRVIPRKNQDGKNYVVRNEDSLNLKVTRNGSPESVSRIESNNDAFLVYIGDASTYVHGTQIYNLEYDFTNVITEFTASGESVSGDENAAIAWQELYWDTNGTGWSQPFDHLTANLHLENDADLALDNSKTSCYVGYAGSSGQSRCSIFRTADGYSFSTDNLSPGENLTFAVNFAPETFDVTLHDSYALILIFIVFLLICALLIFFSCRKWHKKAHAAYHLYKTTPIAPQYLPPENLSTAEASLLVANNKHMKSPYVATLLELAVQRKISIKDLGNKKWSVILNIAPDSLTGPEHEVLSILAYHQPLSKGTEIPVVKHAPDPTMESYAKEYFVQAEYTLAKKGYLKSEEELPRPKKITAAVSIMFWILIILLMPIFFEFFPIIINLDKFFRPMGINLIGVRFLPVTIVVIFILVTIFRTWLSKKTAKFCTYTTDGVKEACYLDGLNMYIKLAEADRLKFLQSVQGADTSPAGLVHFYEKLLPWASLFGHEKSWAKELNRYYDAAVANDPTFTDAALGIVLLSNVSFDDFTSSLDSAISDASSYSSSSSSSSSGGGGGGSSGGGGGGGGGGGW